MANQDRLSLALRPAGDAISDVLDAFQEDKPGLSAANCYLLIQDLKVLVKLIQVLESEHAAKAFRTTPSYTKGEIGEVLHDCGVLAADLKERIQDQILQDDVDLCEQTARLKAKLGLFLRTHGKNKEVLHPGPTQAERLEMDDLSKQASKCTLQSVAHNTNGCRMKDFETIDCSKHLRKTSLRLPG